MTLPASVQRLTAAAAIETLLVGTFAIALFYGDLYFGITVPAAVLLLPIILAVRAASSRGWWEQWRSPPAGLVLLGVVGCTVGVQALLGRGPRGTSDLSVYLPLAYAGLTIAALAGATLQTRTLHRCLVGGGLLAGGILAGTLAIATPGRYALPGQNLAVAQLQEEEIRAKLRKEVEAQDARGGRVPAGGSGTAAKVPATMPDRAAPGRAGVPGPPAPSGASVLAPEVRTPEPEVTGTTGIYYRVKNLARTSLGMSNYLAVIFVFLFNVTLYQRSRWTIVFAVCVLLSISRSGVAFLLLSSLIWYAHRNGRLKALLWVAGGVGMILAVLLALFWPHVTGLPGAESLGTRAWYVSHAFGPIGAHPIFGAPRSEIMRLFGYPITWTPHTSLLHLWVLFGIVGMAAYVSYAVVALRTFGRRAATSDLWRGVTAAVAISFVWSTVELIVLTPSFEILVAALYAIARRPAGTPAAAGA